MKLFLSPSLRPIAMAMAMGSLVAGCGSRDEIARYPVTKPELVDPTPVSTSGPAAAVSDQQILGAIMLVKDRGWFFKLMGDPVAVEPVRSQFVSFVQAIRFTADAEPTPEWTLPDGWTALPGNEFRFATLRLPQKTGAGKALEITVSSAGGDVLANINRWRGQVGLGPITAEELKSSSETFKVGEYDCTFVSLVGAGSGAMSAPMAPVVSGGATPRAAGDKRPASGDIAYEAPPEWAAGTPNQFSLASFSATAGEQKVSITITSAGGDLLANINRWRGQLKLGPMTSAELASSLTKIETLGGHGEYVELISPDGAVPRQTILGVVATAGGRTWFVKLMGDSELAAKEKPRFEAFVKSLKLR